MTLWEAFAYGFFVCCMRDFIVFLWRRGRQWARDHREEIDAFIREDIESHRRFYGRGR